MAGLTEQSEVKGALRRRLPPRAESMMLTQRDIDLIRWVYEARLATREQLQRMFFSQGGRSRCQRRLTLLYRNRYLDKAPNRPLSAPDIYYISRRCSRGLRLLRALTPGELLALDHVHPQTVEHTLEIANCRIAVVRACKATGITLRQWLGMAELARKMENVGIIPDAYFQVERWTSEGPKKASFFLEVERSNKSQRALEEKYRRYGTFYYGGQYEALFAVKALRVLVLVGADYGINSERQIARVAAIARRSDVTMVRFAALSDFLNEPAEQLWVAQIWRHPAKEEPCALF